MRQHGDVLDELRAADPIRTTPSDDASALLRQIVATPVPRARRGRRLLPVLAAATVICVGVAYLSLKQPGPRPVSAVPVELTDIAQVAAGVAPAPEEARFRYVRSENAWTTTVVDSDYTFTYLVSRTREIWVAPDGSGRLREEARDPRFFGPADRQRWIDAGRPELDEGVEDDRYEAGELSYEDFEGLPTEDDALYSEIQTRAEGAGPGLEPEMFTVVGDLLRETAAPPELRAALFRVLGRIPSVEVDPNATDETGRPGIAATIEYDNDGTRFRDELIFDEDTSELLGERNVLLSEVDWVDADPGTVLGYAVYLEEGSVDSVSERPGDPDPT